MLLKLRRTHAVLAAVVVLAGLAVPARAIEVRQPEPFDPSPAGRDTEAVVLTGASFAGWSAPDEVTAKAPTTSGLQCVGGQDEHCTHNKYDDPEVATGDALGQGVPVSKLLGFRWDDRKGKWRQIPFQVDEIATRYLSNNASGFSFYSETDQHQTYVFDEERFNWTAEDPANPCRAVPRDGRRTTPDPVPGLDNNDEIAFMADDAGPAAPPGTPLPKGVAEARQVALADPVGGAVRFAYVMLAADGPDAATPAFDATNGYVRYLPDADSDTFVRSESSYEDYGNTYKGAWYDEATGTCVTDDPFQHRPKDTAWIKTPRFAFRYDGRWLMTQTRVASADQEEANEETADAAQWAYGPDLVDQWKARAFQQRPGGETPCCGYEEEVNNWGGSSMLMGWRAGPVRVIRATWGADSSTNNVRTEVFYRSEMHQLTNLRVHPMPPADGIYAQWDFNATKMTRYSNPFVPDGVPIDGRNDEVFGNGRVHASRNGLRYQADDRTGVAPLDERVNQGISVNDPPNRCPDDNCVNNDIDTFDPTLHGPAGTLAWEQTSGPDGTFVDRSTVRQHNGGAAWTLVTTPYYRDDACFDDGTGSDPGLHTNSRAVDDDVDAAGNPRECWTPEHGDPSQYSPADHFYQGSIGTHGIHILFIGESDNAFLTAPVTELSTQFRRVVLNGDAGKAAGETYGRSLEKPLVPVVAPFVAGGESSKGASGKRRPG